MKTHYAIIAASAALLFPATAHAFAEDICFEETGLSNCNDLSCQPGDYSVPCRAQAVADGAAIATGAAEGRSTLHTDATFFLAQAAGYSADYAYWIAAYDQAIDLKQYVHRDVCGEEMASEYSTVFAAGLERVSLATGGWCTHMSLPYNAAGTPVPGIDGMEPDVHDHHHETLLYNTRNWAFAGDDLCVLGLTDKPGKPFRADMVGCYEEQDTLQQKHLKIPAPLLSVGPTPPIWSYLGKQVFDFTSSSPGTFDDVVFAQGPAFQQHIGAHPEAAVRMGAYLHILQDRVSHHVCGDSSAISGPNALGNFTANYDQGTCNQVLHALEHVWEIGYSNLSPQTEAALAASYDELVAFRAVVPASALVASAANADDAVQAALAPLKVSDPNGRVQTMMSTIAAWGLTQLPGHSFEEAAACGQ